MESPKVPSLLERIQQHRLASAFTLLTTLTVGILAGSVLTRNVGAAEQQVDSSSARPLVVPSPVTPLKWLLPDREAGWSRGRKHQHRRDPEAGEGTA